MDQIVLVRHQIEEQTFALVFRIRIQRFGHPMYCDILTLKRPMSQRPMTFDFF